MLTVDGMKSYGVKRYKGSDPSSLVIAKDMFYVCYPEVCSILCFDECFELQQKIAVNGTYYAMCYDAEQRCFYALDACCPGMVFILNTKFYEIGRMVILDHQDVFPISIAFCDGCMYVAYETHIVRISSKQTQEICYQCDEAICAITCTSSNIAVLVSTEHGYELCVFDPCMQKMICEELCLDGCILAIAMGDDMYVLSKQSEDTFCIFQVPLCKEEEVNCEVDPTTIFFDSGEIEKGIACVLNSEGMKIQYAIEQGASIEELLKINQSVIHVVNELTQLELSLYNRLHHCVCHDACDHEEEWGECK